MKILRNSLVFVLVVALHILLLSCCEPHSQEIVVPKKETVQKLDLRNVTIKPEPKPKPKPKVRPKPKPKPKLKPKPKPVPQPAPEPKPEPEVKKEEIVEQEPIKEEISTQPESEEVLTEEATLSSIEIESIKAAYIASVKKAIELKKYYPKKAKRLKREGIVEVCFTIYKNGTIKEVGLQNPSKYKRLNEGALETLKRVGRFEPIPTELGMDSWQVVVPIEYRLR